LVPQVLALPQGTVLERVDSPLRAHLRFAGLLAWQHGSRSPATGNLLGNSPRQAEPLANSLCHIFAHFVKE